MEIHVQLLLLIFSSSLLSFCISSTVNASLSWYEPTTLDRWLITCVSIGIVRLCTGSGLVVHSLSAGTAKHCINSHENRTDSRIETSLQ